MYSMIFAVYPKSGMSREECAEYLLSEHSKISARMPHAKTVRQFGVTGTHEARDNDIAAFTLIEFDSVEDFQAAASSPVMKEANSDAENFASHIAVYNVEANVVI